MNVLHRRGTWLWPVVNLLGWVAVVAVNGLANAIPFNGQTTGEVINKDPIYALLGGFVVYGLLPTGR